LIIIIKTSPGKMPADEAGVKGGEVFPGKVQD
jgi:hypothetical protein